ncbi:hypothetical protein J0K78_03315 [Halobacillus sp. GSS1]|uniref:hypothetical protein n=1 Tax=Halobacillus sp. GSS1 TaxID=2815919 RepID=UPI001A8FED0A|nr:hypothetical protein [Halobacillus sp. GSS1]MBN9653283.1 hypothetical protein [Halobacillus sp. GSS1]
MLTDKIATTKDVMEQAKVLDDKIQQHQKFVEFDQAVTNLNQKVLPIIDAISTLHQYDHIYFTKLDLGLVISKLENTLETFESEPKKGQLIGIGKEIEEKGNTYKEKWHAFSTREMEDATRTLKSIRGLVEDKKEIDDIITSLRKIAQRWPVTEKNVTYFDRLLQDVKSKINNLQVSPSIQAFLEKVMNEQASLSDITPEIADWLQEQDFSNNLIISFKRG